jgi:hypothetical protein
MSSRSLARTGPVIRLSGSCVRMPAKIGIGGRRVKETPVFERNGAVPRASGQSRITASTVRAWMQSRAIWMRSASTLSNLSSSRSRSMKAQHSHWP